MKLTELETPALVLDRGKLDANLNRMSSRLAQLGVKLRPHVKTVKSIDVIERALDSGTRGITVSTLKEAEYFLARGIADIVYGVGIAPSKCAHVADLIRRGARLTCVLDNDAAAGPLAKAAASAGVRVPVLIELDVDGHRSGVQPASPALADLAKAISRFGELQLAGVLTHAGGSYDCRNVEEIAQIAERERAGAVESAGLLRKMGHAAPVVSVGSTPTATFARELSGVTEVRVGVYMTQDLVMAGLGVCRVEDIALSVLVSVIGHQPDRNWIITDGGWMALSRDRGTASHTQDQGYGLARDVTGESIGDELIVSGTNQEHGILTHRDGRKLDLERFPVGTLLRILPNHACATAAQYDRYMVVDGADPRIVAQWERFRGW